ncbi:helix-turn-helix transcriptional regulator [Dactylosporangium sp. CS-047395]|uniref:helix-turn-helix transcriptional regulator n=1 Tax=Dactylosporangium sp. CS-047395 TaxID=3239936 RepID=UPI003D929E76
MDDFDGIAALAEPVRRALFRFVAAQPEPVGREQVAAAVGVPHHVAKFHLDKLEAEGLLEVEYRRPPGRGGPGAGRPAKLYRRAAREIALSVPPRRYDLVGRVMAAAIAAAERTATPVTETLPAAARDAGRALGEQARRPAPAADLVRDVLAGNGYEPLPTTTGIALANCPFRALAVDWTDVVCAINVDLVGGLLTALGADGELEARLAPDPGRCCVVVEPRP